MYTHLCVYIHVCIYKPPSAHLSVCQHYLKSWIFRGQISWSLLCWAWYTNTQMYIYIYMYVYVYISIHMCLCIHTHTRTHEHTHTRTHTFNASFDVSILFFRCAWKQMRIGWCLQPQTDRVNDVPHAYVLHHTLWSLYYQLRNRTNGTNP